MSTQDASTCTAHYRAAIEGLLAFYSHVTDASLERIANCGPAGILTAGHARAILNARVVVAAETV